MRRRRSAFTLIELMVVIAIIALLVSLLMSAVQRVRRTATEVKARNDISQLDTAVAAFKLKFGVDYLPSFFAVRPLYDPVDPDFVYLKRLFPRCSNAPGLSLALASGGSYPPYPGTNSASGWALEGDQCLIFFLCGPDGFNGFSTDASRPFATVASQGESRQGPFFEATADRLVLAHGSSPFASLADPFNGLPYLYFSSYGNNNYFYSTPSYPKQSIRTGYSAPGDCPSSGVLPYLSGYSGAAAPYLVQFLNKSSHQIVSAGHGGAYGTGGTPLAASPSLPQIWNPSTGYPEKIPGTGPPPLPEPGVDDISNFSAYKLGNAAN